MKKSVFSLITVIVATWPGAVFGGYYDAPDDVGTYSYSSGKSPIGEGMAFPTSTASKSSVCFEAGAYEFDIYAGYAWAEDDTGPFSDDGLAIGIGAQTFYTDVLGFRLQGHVWNADSAVGDVVGDVSASIIGRFPLKSRTNIAPYVYGGGGGLFGGGGDARATGHLGVGLDYRLDHFNCTGLVLDFRHTWVDQSDGYFLLTLGLRFSF